MKRLDPEWEFGNTLECFMILFVILFLVWMLANMPELAEIIRQKNEYHIPWGLKLPYE